MLTLEWLQPSHRFILSFPFALLSGYLAKRIFNLTFFFPLPPFWPFSAFHHLAHNLVISFEMLGLAWLGLAPSGSALCAICQMSNACQRQHVRAISYASFFDIRIFFSFSWYIQALNVLDSTAPSVCLGSLGVSLSHSLSSSLSVPFTLLGSGWLIVIFCVAAICGF